MSKVKITTLTENREKNIYQIIKVKAKIKELEKSIEDMVTDIKTYMIDTKIEEVVTETGVKVCTLGDSVQTPSFKAVYDIAEPKLSPAARDILLKAYDDGKKPTKRIIFG
jgi:phosphoribosylaminoimidazole-succinocarboxamide synthase